jgi:nitroreductase
MTEKTTQTAGLAPAAEPIPLGQAAYLVRVAARAPSVHNTQPWRFKVCQQAIELYADRGRQLSTDPVGREMLISCGAALYGLRLAVRSLGRVGEVELFPAPEPGRPLFPPAGLRLLARVRLGSVSPLNPAERKMLDAVPHRHTHRGPFEPVPLPAGLLAELQADAIAEGATLAVVDTECAGPRLATILAAPASDQDLDPVAQAEIVRWTRAVDSQARDGVPAHAFPARPRPKGRPKPGRLPERDFDLGRGLGLQPPGDQAAPVTAVLVTAGDSEEDWLRAGQALNRLLMHAASQWTFARLQTQGLQAAATRGLIRSRLALPGAPQLLLQLGVARTARSVGRRPAADLMENGDL